MSIDILKRLEKFDGVPLSGLPNYSDNELFLSLNEIFKENAQDWLLDTEEYSEQYNLDILGACSWECGRIEDEAFLVIDNALPENPVKFFSEDELIPIADSLESFLDNLQEDQEHLSSKIDVVKKAFLPVYNKAKNCQISIDELIDQKVSFDDVWEEADESIYVEVCESLNIEEQALEIDEYVPDENYQEEIIPVFEVIKVIANQYEAK